MPQKVASAQFSSVQLLSHVRLFETLCTPGLPIHHQLPEFTQTHVHWVSNAIQPSHPLSSPSPPALSLSQYQGLFKWVRSSHQVAKVGVSASTSVLPMNIQDWFPLGLTGLISLLSKDSHKTSPTPQFESINASVLSFLYSPISHIHTWLLEKP